MATTGPPVYVLYINMAAAQRRRAHMESQLAGPIVSVLGASDIQRMPAAEGTADDGASQLLTPWASLMLQQPLRASAHAQIETVGAVGCYLSHMRCWDWLLAKTTDENAVLFVLEDDACFTSDFGTVWQQIVNPLLRIPAEEREWDLLLLGYFNVRGTRDCTVHGVPLRTFELGPESIFFGGHGYLVTRRGARLLRERALPMEVQVDHYFLILNQLGWLRLFLPRAKKQCVEQCLASVDVGIRHGYHEFRNCTTLLPISGWLLILLMLTLLVTLVVYWYGRCPVVGGGDASGGEGVQQR